MTTLKRILFAIFLLATTSSLEARESKINLSQTVLFVGESANNIPEGSGTLYVMEKPSKKPVLRQDVITGVFSGNNISSAKVSFSSGWKFEGNLTFSIVTVSEKPLQEDITYNLTGNLKSPDEKEDFFVNNLQLKRLTTNGAEALKTNTMHFKATRKADDGNSVDYEVELYVEKDSWSATSMRRFAPAVFFEGEKISERPFGHGKLSVLASDNMAESTAFDIIQGDFSGNEVKNAKVTFSSGWLFSGSMNYEVRQTWPEPYTVEIKYVLFGKLLSQDGKKELNMDGDSLIMTVKKGEIVLTPYSWKQRISVPSDRVSSYDEFVQGESDSIDRLVVFTLEPTANGSSSWTVTQRNGSEFPEFHYSSGYVIMENGKGFSIQYPTADYLEINNDSRIVSITKTFPNCIVNLSEESSKILWSDGSSFEGSFKINGISYGSYLSDCKSEVISLMNPDLFIDEIPLQYLTGTYTYSNGKSEKWVNGITDYQQNKLNGNYEKVSAAVEKALREENAAYGAELERKWQAALPGLRQKYGRANVDAIYNYRLNRKTPVELFQDLNRLGLIKLQGPIWTTGSRNSINQYVIYMTNRQTGELQYSLVLKFVHPFWSSPDWILDTYSTTF